MFAFFKKENTVVENNFVTHAWVYNLKKKYTDYYSILSRKKLNIWKINLTNSLEQVKHSE